MTYAVGAQFRGEYSKYFAGTVYDYLVPDEIELRVGDYIVVDTVNGLGLAKVHDLKTSSKKATRYVVQKVDLTAFEERQERARRRSVIEAKLRVLEKEVMQQQRENFLRNYSPEAAELLRQLETL